MGLAKSTDQAKYVPQQRPHRLRSIRQSITSLPWLHLLAGAAAFIVRRLAYGVVVLLCIVYLSFLGLDMAGGIRLAAQARTGGGVGADLLASAGRALPQTAAYLSRLLQGDLGLTSAGSSTYLLLPTAQVIAERLPRSLGLLGVTMLVSVLAGVSLGFTAARGRSQRSMLVILFTLLGVSTPSFLAAFLLQWALTTYTRQAGHSLLPAGGFGWDAHLVLPVLVLAARPVAQIMRITFVSVREALDQDYVRTAASKGLGNERILWVHVLRNAAIPILTTIGVSLRFALASCRWWSYISVGRVQASSCLNQSHKKTRT